MREIFVPHNFKTKTLARIEQADAILTEYTGQGFTLTFGNCSISLPLVNSSRTRRQITTLSATNFEAHWRKPRRETGKRRRTSCANSWRII